MAAMRSSPGKEGSSADTMEGRDPSPQRGQMIATSRRLTRALATPLEFEQANGIRGPKAPEWMPALRKPQAFIDEGGHPLILERDERTNSELPRDGLSLARIPTQQVGQGEGLGHADRAARQETLQGQEVLRVRCVGLVAALEDGATDEVRPGSDGLSLCHGRALRTQGRGNSFCRKIIRQMTKFPTGVEDPNRSMAIHGSLQSRVYPHRWQMTLQFRSYVGPPQTSHGSGAAGVAALSDFVALDAAVMPKGHGDRGRKASLSIRPLDRKLRLGTVWSRAKPGEVVEYDHRRVAARCARDAPSRVSAAPAEVQPSYGRPVAGPSGERPEGEQLVRRHIGLIDAAAREAPLPLHVERRDDFPRFDRMGHVRSKARERLQDRIPDLFLAIVPISVPEAVRGVLRVDGQREFSRR